MTWDAFIEKFEAEVRASSNAADPARIAAQYRAALQTYSRWVGCHRDDEVSPYLDVPLEQLLSEVDEMSDDLGYSLDTRYAYRSRLRRAWQTYHSSRS